MSFASLSDNYMEFMVVDLGISGAITHKYSNTMKVPL